MFKKILIANRGEISLRIIRTCREMGIKSVAVFSTADRESLHVRFADEAVCIGPASSAESYLSIPKIMAAAEITNADAIHPGYGFLSENADFAEVCAEYGIKFIGPTPEHIRKMGDKVTAKETMIKAGVPVVPGSDGLLESVEQGQKLAKKIGYPVILKATAGGGGKGMRIVWNDEEFETQWNMARNEARASFGNDGMYMEKFIEEPRHIEFQIAGDQFGKVCHLSERECSIQRRHQKLLEESPSPFMTDELREKMGAAAILAGECINYEGVGTVEFLVDKYRNFYFMEMNTRIQVEHPISELITGVDLVQEQIRVASGEALGYGQEDIVFSGHAIECRINAEHPETFMPSPGLITDYHAPGGPHVRVDSHLYNGYKIPPHYDSLVSKLIVYGRNRPECLARLRRALDEYVIGGIHTLLPLHKRLAECPDMQAGHYDIHWLERDFLKTK